MQIGKYLDFVLRWIKKEDEPVSYWLDRAKQVKAVYSLGDLDGARRVIEDACSSRESEQSADYLAFLNNAALVYGELGVGHLSRETASEALRLSESLYPPGHPEVVDSQLGMAVAYMYSGSAERALDFLHEARRTTAGDSFPRPDLKLRVLRTLGSAFGMLGDVGQEALAVEEAHVLATEQKVSPAELSFFQSELGLSLIARGRLEEGRDTLASAYATRLEKAPAGNFGLASAAHNLGWANEKLADWMAAQAFYAQSHQWRAENLGHDAAATIRSLEGLRRCQAMADRTTSLDPD